MKNSRRYGYPGKRDWREGFVPGIWTSPFVMHTHSRLYREHPDWVLRRHDGSEEVFIPGVVALDITHPEVLDWIEALYRRLSREGWRYQLDFTRAPVQTAQVAYHNPSLTRAQAYRGAMKAVRRGIGDGYLLICGGLYSAPVGLAEGHRTGSDVRSRWPEPDRTLEQTSENRENPPFYHEAESSPLVDGLSVALRSRRPHGPAAQGTLPGL